MAKTIGCYFLPALLFLVVLISAGTVQGYQCDSYNFCGGKCCGDGNYYCDPSVYAGASCKRGIGALDYASCSCYYNYSNCGTCGAGTCSNCDGGDCNTGCYISSGGGGGGGGGGGSTGGSGSLNITITPGTSNINSAVTATIGGSCGGGCETYIGISPGGGLSCGGMNQGTGCPTWSWYENCTAIASGTFTATGTSSSCRATTSYTVVDPRPQSFSMTSPSTACLNGNPYIDLAWTPSTNASYYNVYREISGGSYQYIGYSYGTSYRDTAIAQGTAYYYYIDAHNGYGDTYAYAPNWITSATCYVACSVPAPSTVCSGTYTDSHNYTCTGTKDCTTPDSATINGFPTPGKTCYKQSEFPLAISVSAHDAGVGIGPNGISVHLYKSDGTFVKNYLTGCNPAVQTCNATASIPYTDLIQNQQYYLKISATDANGNGPYNSPTQTGSFYANANCINPFFDTSGGGDVHSNTKINTPGGP